MGFAMQRLLIRNISKLVSCDEGDTVYENVDLYAEDGVIRAIGPKLEKPAEEVLDAGHMLCYPGLINTHHHLYQQFSRNLPQVQNMELFDWLKTLYEIWKNLDTDVVRLSSLTGMGELMKHGCTTCFDHHYVFPAGAGDLIGTQFEAASELGIRMHCSRGSMDLSVKDGGLPPDSVVQTVDEIMKDSARLIETYHDPAFGSMRQLALAPCSPFSVSAELLRQSAILARQYHVRLHTHLCETKDEENYMLAREGMRPLTSFIFKSKGQKISIPWFILFFVLALVVNTYLLDGVPQLGATINGIARKTLTITMFFIGASLSIDVLKAVGIKPLIQGILLWIIISLSTLAYIYFV